MENTQSYNLPVVAANASITERMAFLKKIYGLLSISILMAAGASWFTLNNEGFFMVVAQNQMLFFIVEIAAIFFTFWARKKETLGLVALFSLQHSNSKQEGVFHFYQ